MQQERLGRRGGAAGVAAAFVEASTMRHCTDLGGGTTPRKQTVLVLALLALGLPAVLLLTPVVVRGAAGDLDPGFGSGGRVTTPIGTSATAAAIVLQPDGKIVVAGQSSNGTVTKFALARYTGTGSLDASFGSGGTVTTAVGAFDSVADAVALQADGKIVAAGSSDDCVPCPIHAMCCTGRFALARYTATGSLDASFGSGGRVTTVTGTTAGATAVALQPDGKIVAAGFSWNGSTNVFAVSRYTATGSLDASFGSAGTVTTAIGTNAIALAAALQPDGEIVVAGYAFAAGSPPPISIALARYTATGSLDAGFGSGGTVTTATTVAQDVVLQPDGKIIVAGNVYNGTTNDFALARYTADGSLDASFGSGGTVTTAISTGAAAHAVALQPDGKIVAAGRSYRGSNDDFALARYTADGSLDASFGGGGTVITTIGTSAIASAVGLQPDGKIVAAGYSFNGSTDDVALARYFGGPACGDSTVDPGEECDDGNTADGDCCSSNCRFEPTGAGCKDGNFCTMGETCDGAGVCGGFTSCRTGSTCNICGATCTLQAGVCKCG